MTNEVEVELAKIISFFSDTSSYINTSTSSSGNSKTQRRVLGTPILLNVVAHQSMEYAHSLYLRHLAHGLCHPLTHAEKILGECYLH